mgnify:CR=1 FL=1
MPAVLAEVDGDPRGPGELAEHRSMDGIGLARELRESAPALPVLLAGAWYLTNRVFLKVMENAIKFDNSEGPMRLRRAEYVRSLALGAPAAKEVRVFGLGDWVVSRYGDAWLDALRLMWRTRRTSRGLSTATAVALAVSHGIVLGALAMAVSRGELTAAALVVFVQAVIATVDLGIAGDQQFFLAQSLATAERVAKLTADAPPPSFEDEMTLPANASAAAPGSPAPASASPAPQQRVALRLDGVRFTYRGRERPTLDGLTLEVPAGQSLAVVGENGAGKSTLIKLLCGLYTPQDGSIVLDGGVSPREARGRVAAIFQDFFISTPRLAKVLTIRHRRRTCQLAVALSGTFRSHMAPGRRPSPGRGLPARAGGQRPARA